jgi:hypothetical protein
MAKVSETQDTSFRAGAKRDASCMCADATSIHFTSIPHCYRTHTHTHPKFWPIRDNGQHYWFRSLFAPSKLLLGYPHTHISHRSLLCAHMLPFLMHPFHFIISYEYGRESFSVVFSLSEYLLIHPPPPSRAHEEESFFRSTLPTHSAYTREISLIRPTHTHRPR